MKYAVEARIFNNGKIITKLRLAEEEEESRKEETRTCDIWIDVFNTHEEARLFREEYKKA